MDNSRLVSIVINHYRHGDTEKWKSAIAASLVVGQYERGAAIEIAHALRLASVSTVENLAACGKCFLLVQPHGVLREIRDNLRFSHFHAVWRHIKSDNITPKEAAQLLIEAEAEGVSAEDVKKMLDAQYGEIEKPLNARRLIDDLFSYFDDNPVALEHLRALKGMLKC